MPRELAATGRSTLGLAGLHSSHAHRKIIRHTGRVTVSTKKGVAPMATSTKNGKAPGKEIEPVELHAQSVGTYQPGVESWDDWAAADQIIGHDLAKDELLDALVGIPFAVTAVTFRPGIRKAGQDYRAAFVSCESVIAPENVLRRRRVNMEMLPFEPGSQVVFNDGSTGIYRQIVQYLAAKEWITLPDLPENGAYGETKYDLPPFRWESITVGDYEYTDEDSYVYAANVRLVCPRGLRISEYESDFNPNGSKTRYLG